MNALIRFPAAEATADPWLASHDALDLAALIVEEAGNIGAAGNTLFNESRNHAAMDEAEAAARRTLAIIGRLRRMAS